MKGMEGGRGRGGFFAMAMGMAMATLTTTAMATTMAMINQHLLHDSDGMIEVIVYFSFHIR
jgi:hypothetical protein